MKKENKWMSWLGIIIVYASVFLYIYTNVIKE